MTRLRAGWAALAMADDFAEVSVSARGVDVVAVGCHGSAELSAMRLGRSSCGVVLPVADDAPVSSAMGSVLVVRAGDAEGLLRAWDTGVAR